MDIILSILMLAGLGLIAGGIMLARRGHGKKALLMVVAALIMFGNVAIWLVPTQGAGSLADAAREK